ncbi:MAG: D-serine ammonia-lyase [Clostridiaceae bacterium]|nr:D-serine ammonia-lyase [Clostridiaceae bacterium]
MDEKTVQTLRNTTPALQKLAAGEAQIWLNPKLRPAAEALPTLPLAKEDIADAEARLHRFAPYLVRRFPETAEQGGLIESPLTEIPRMQAAMQARGAVLPGRLFLKQDSHLAIAGSVKARGGIYEVLYHTEQLALKHGLLDDGDYAGLDSEQARAFFRKYTIQVGSTGNLGMSIGIMSAAIGYRVIVHMSADARQWKKDLLRQWGVEVIEYASDYCEAVARGRALSDADPDSYFVDDENSRTLFLGYAVAAGRLQAQLREKNIVPDKSHPLVLWLPCGVGGAPGGITFGIKHVFGDAAHCFFAEPVQAPCMLAGMASGLHNAVDVKDFGLSGKTDADGLAVQRASGFVGRVVEPLMSGEITLQDADLYDYMRMLTASEDIFIEPSACAAFAGPDRFLRSPEGKSYLATHGLKAEDLIQIAWATGGVLVPPEMRQEYEQTYLR